MGKVLKLSCLLLVLALVLSCQAQAQENEGPRLITVTGDAEVKVVPDEVIITLGVETDNKDLNVAKTENDDKIKKLSMPRKILKLKISIFRPII